MQVAYCRPRQGVAPASIAAVWEAPVLAVTCSRSDTCRCGMDVVCGREARHADGLHVAFVLGIPVSAWLDDEDETKRAA